MVFILLSGIWWYVAFLSRISGTDAVGMKSYCQIDRRVTYFFPNPLYRDKQAFWWHCDFFPYCPNFICPSMWKWEKWIILCAFWNLNALKVKRRTFRLSLITISKLDNELFWHISKPWLINTYFSERNNNNMFDTDPEYSHDVTAWLY